MSEIRELLTLDEEYSIIFTPWVIMVPEFQKLIKLDKGMDGDYRGDKKLKSKKQLAYISLMIAFKSPIYDWDSDEKHLEALRYTGLQDTDITSTEMQDAMSYYASWQYNASKSLKTLEAMKKGLRPIDAMLESPNFDKTDKLGRPMYSMKDHLANIVYMDKVHIGIENFERRVLAELKAGSTGVRGKNSKLGGKEGTRDAEWKEGGNPLPAKVGFTDLMSFTDKLTGIKEQELAEEAAKDEEE